MFPFVLRGDDRRFMRLVVMLAAVATLAAAADIRAQPRSAPGAFAAAARMGTPAPRLYMTDGGPAREIRLAAPSGSEPRVMTKSDIVNDKNRPLRIGFERVPADADRRVGIAELPWQSVDDGGLAARVAVTSATAAATRLRLETRGAPAELEVRFKGTAGEAQVFAAQREELAADGGMWSPVLEGQTALVELHLPAGVRPAGDLVLHGIAHLLVAGAQMKALEEIGTSGACEHDVVCSGMSPAVELAARSVVQTIVEDEGFTVLCTGTLLNSIPQSNVPYLLTAYHCYDEDHVRTEAQVQAIADSLTTYWFFDASACGSEMPGNYTQVAGGATLLYRGPDVDVILLQMRNAPPTGAWFSAWDANSLPSGTSALVLHHPQGDLKKLSSGFTRQYATADGRGSFIGMGYTYGSTEAGSSGAPLLTCADGGASCDQYVVRGALWGGAAACTNPNGGDLYSRLDLAYAYIAKYIAPNDVMPAGDGVAVEFYNVDLDHFFLTAEGAEQVGIDGGSAGPGWFRTGHSFNTLVAGANPLGVPVCRFYGSVSPGPNSHFYTLDAGECAYLKHLQAIQPATQPRWNFESIAFYNMPPSGTICPANTTPIYRYYNNGFPVKDSNHRFVASLEPNMFMLDEGWAFEGVAMCAPN